MAPWSRKKPPVVPSGWAQSASEFLGADWDSTFVKQRLKSWDAGQEKEKGGVISTEVLLDEKGVPQRDEKGNLLLVRSFWDIWPQKFIESSLGGVSAGLITHNNLMGLKGMERIGRMLEQKYGMYHHQGNPKCTAGVCPHGLIQLVRTLWKNDANALIARSFTHEDAHPRIGVLVAPTSMQYQHGGFGSGDLPMGLPQPQNQGQLEEKKEGK